MIIYIVGIIVVIVFLLLVCFIGIFLMWIIKMMGEVNCSLNNIMDDVDVLLYEIEKIMVNVNEFLKDVNGKVVIIDLVF